MTGLYSPELMIICTRLQIKKTGRLDLFTIRKKTAQKFHHWECMNTGITRPIRCIRKIWGQETELNWLKS